MWVDRFFAFAVWPRQREFQRWQEDLPEDGVSENDEFGILNEELCIKSEEFCIKSDEFGSEGDPLVRSFD